MLIAMNVSGGLMGRARHSGAGIPGSLAARAGSIHGPFAATPRAAWGTIVATRSPTMDELWRWRATDLADAIRTRRISSREATEACLARTHAVNPLLNAIVDLREDEALRAADDAERAVARGDARLVVRNSGLRITRYSLRNIR
jgi:hypothetical protein